MHWNKTKQKLIQDLTSGQITSRLLFPWPDKVEKRITLRTLPSRLLTPCISFNCVFFLVKYRHCLRAPFNFLFISTLLYLLFVLLHENAPSETLFVSFSVNAHVRKFLNFVLQDAKLFTTAFHFGSLFIPFLLSTFSFVTFVWGCLDFGCLS